MKKVLLITLIIIGCISCKKENSILSKWDVSKTIEINLPDYPIAYGTPCYDDSNTILISINGVSQLGNFSNGIFTISDFNGVVISKLGTEQNLLKTCQQTQRDLCNSNWLCTIPYNASIASRLVMEALFASYCSASKNVPN